MDRISIGDLATHAASRIANTPTNLLGPTVQRIQKEIHTMTKQIPRVISFADIRKGDTVEQTTLDGSKVTIVATRPSPDGRFWYSPDSGQSVLDKDGCTVRLLNRPGPAITTALEDTP